MAVPNLLETHVLRGMIYLPLYLAVSSVSSHRQLSSIIVATALLLIVFAAAAAFQVYQHESLQFSEFDA